MTAPSISLIICTRHRPVSLARTLNTVARLQVPPGGGEVLIVDGSDPGLASTSHRVDPRPVPARGDGVNDTLDLRVIHRPGPGLGRARNVGVRSARGAICCFTDDDCLLGADHLVQIVQAFAEHPIDFASGPVLAAMTSDPREALDPSDVFDYLAPGDRLAPGCVQGANLALRRDMFESLGGFGEDLGAGTQFRCEDIDLCARATSAGFRGAHLIKPVVWHDPRRTPREIRGWIRANDRARGAFYVRQVLSGDLGYGPFWARRARRRLGRRPSNVVRNAPRVLGELVGGAAHAAALGRERARSNGSSNRQRGNSTNA